MHWSVLALAVTSCVVCATVPLAAIWVVLLMLELPGRRPRPSTVPPPTVALGQAPGRPALQGEPRERVASDVECEPRQQVVWPGEETPQVEIDDAVAVDRGDAARTEQWLQELIAASQLEDW